MLPFWGEMVSILIGTISILLLGPDTCTNSAFNKELLWSQRTFDFQIICNWVLTLGFILYALIGKIKIRKTKFLRDYDFNQKIIVGLGISCIFITIIMLPNIAAFLHSVIFEFLYVILSVVISYKVIVKLYREEMTVLYGRAYQNQRAMKVNKFTDWISKNIIVLGAILFLVKGLFSGLKNIQGALLTAIAPLFIMALWWFGLWFYFEKILEGYYLKKYSEQYRQLYGYSKDEWYGDKVDDWNRMKTIEKHLKQNEEERKLKKKIEKDVKGIRDDEE